MSEPVAVVVRGPRLPCSNGNCCVLLRLHRLRRYCSHHASIICKYPNAQFTSTGNGIPISRNGTHFQYCPFSDPTSGNFPFGTVPKLAICHYWYCAGLICTISGTGLCHFRYGHSLGPVPELDSMCVIPFPVLGSASSGMVVSRVPYRNWTLCV